MIGLDGSDYVSNHLIDLSSSSSTNEMTIKYLQHRLQISLMVKGLQTYRYLTLTQHLTLQEG